VVDVSADVVDEALADVSRGLVEVEEELFGAEFGELRVPFEEAVGVVHVSPVVLIMVDAHGLGIEMRFEGVVGVGQRREGVRAAGGGDLSG
jgi:hypothetical protein